MISLLINNLPAIPAEKTSIKIILENRAYSSAEAYTLDIELPMDIPENLRIFGPLHRLDVGKQSVKYNAELWGNNVKILSGIAKITGVTQSVVKVQLLADSAAYNEAVRSEELYIDRLTMPKWRECMPAPEGDFEPETPDTSYPRPGGLPVRLYDFLSWPYRPGTRSAYNMIWTNLQQTPLPFVFMPVYNTNTDKIMNPLTFEPFRVTSGNKVTLEWDLVMREWDNMEACPYDKYSAYSPMIAPMPFFWWIVEQVASGTGYTLSREDNYLYTNPFFRRIFFVNTANYDLPNRCLPHWSVGEFWDNIEHTFGVIMRVDYAAKKIKLEPRGSVLMSGSTTGEAIWLQRVFDEYNVEMNHTGRGEITTGNVGFSDFEGDAGVLLDDWIRNKAELITDYSILQELCEAAPRDKNKIYITADGRRYIYCDHIEKPELRENTEPAEAFSGYLEVDMLRPRIADPERPDTLDVELKITPASLCWNEADTVPVHLHGVYESGGFGDLYTGYTTHFPMLMLQVPGVSTLDNCYEDTDIDGLDIEAAINGEQEDSEDKSEVPDVMYMAIFDSYEPVMQTTAKCLDVITEKTLIKTVDFPRPYAYERSVVELTDDDYTLSRDGEPWSLSLNFVDGQVNLAAETIAGSPGVDTSVRYCCKFLCDDARHPDVEKIYCIRGKLYVCEKIELDLSPSASVSAATGYFFPLT